MSEKRYPKVAQQAVVGWTGTGAPVLNDGPTILAPLIVGSINDAADQPILEISGQASAVEYITLTNAAAGGEPSLASSSDLGLAASGDVNLAPGSGTAYVNSDAIMVVGDAPTAHSTSHKDGGGDEVSTATPAQGAIPKASVEGALADDWIRPEFYTRREMQYLKDGGSGVATFTTLGHAAPTTSGTISGVDTTNNPFARFVTGASSGNSAGVISGAILRRDWDVDITFHINTGNTITDYRLWAGMTSADLNAVATPTTQHVAAFRYDTGVDGTAFWRTVTNDGVGAATVTTTTTAFASATSYRLRVRTSTSRGDIRFYIDDVLVATHTATRPGNTTYLSYQWVTTTLTAATRRGELNRVGILHK